MPNYDFVDENILTIYQGDDYFDTVTITHPEDGSAFDLTDCTWQSVLKDFGGVLAATFVCTCDDLTSGVIKRHISATETADLIPNKDVTYVWAVQITDSEGYLIPEIHGGAKVKEGVI